MATTHERLGPIDILVCNAGINPFYGSMSKIPDAAFDKILSSNVKANHWLCQMGSPGHAGPRARAPSCSPPAPAPSPVPRCWAPTTSPSWRTSPWCATWPWSGGRRACASTPSARALIKTDFARALWDNEKTAKLALAQTPLRRFGEAEDLKGVAVFLASDASAYVTGQALTLCGGAYMWR